MSNAWPAETYNDNLDMVTDSKEEIASRVPLSKERVLRAAVELADNQGLDALTMRRLAEELGVEAMSIYYHVANKEALLDGVADIIVTEIEQVVGNFDDVPQPSDWRLAMRQRILSAREIMLKHPWAPTVFESRTAISLPTMRYFNSLLGIFRAGGLTYDLAHHAMHALGSRALGFTQELFNPDTPDADADADAMMKQMADQLPYLVGMLADVVHDDPESTLGWCDDQTEFEFGLDVILDGVDRLHRISLSG